MSKYYYAVKSGKIPGIYFTWKDCESQVRGYSGAIYKKFTTIGEAEDFIKGIEEINKPSKVKIDSEKEIGRASCRERV